MRTYRTIAHLAVLTLVAAILTIAHYALGQAVPGSYPYPVPLSTSGAVPWTQNVTHAPLAPPTYDSSQPAVWDTFIGGGHRSVNTLAERTNLNSGFKKEGMTAFVAATGYTYRLKSDLSTWSTLGGVDATDLALNTSYTNSTAGPLYVSGCFTLTATAADPASVGLYIDQDASGAYEVTGIKVQAPKENTNAAIYQLSGWLAPGARYVLTNLSSGSATAAVVSGSFQSVRH